jgi:putative protease
MDEELQLTVRFLEKIQAAVVVTNNTGVAFAAFERGIRWIAGPHLNVVNSYSLKCLKKEFGCSGAFVSNELSRTQIGAIKCPADFKMFYSIFHPPLLMTSRQCLFLSVTGCAKNVMDQNCLTTCAKVASITNKRGQTLIIEKSPGNIHRVYNDTHFLNVDIVTDMPGRFDGFLIDLRNIPTHTRLSIEHPALIALFEQSLAADKQAIATLKQVIAPWMNTPYQKGI